MKKVILIAMMMAIVEGAFADSDLFKCQGHAIKGVDGAGNGTVIMDVLNHTATWQSEGATSAYVIAGADDLCDFDISHSSCRPVWGENKWYVNISTFCSMAGNSNGATDGILAYSKVGRNGHALCKAIKKNRISDMEVRFDTCQPIARQPEVPAQISEK